MRLDHGVAPARAVHQGSISQPPSLRRVERDERLIQPTVVSENTSNLLLAEAPVAFLEVQTAWSTALLVTDLVREPCVDAFGANTVSARLPQQFQFAHLRGDKLALGKHLKAKHTRATLARESPKRRGHLLYLIEGFIFRELARLLLFYFDRAAYAEVGRLALLGRLCGISGES